MTTTIRVILSTDWAGSRPVVDAVRSFERAHPDVQVDVEGVQFEFIPETVRAAIARGNPHDVAQWHAFAAGAQGMAEVLDDEWMKELDEKEFLPGAVEDVTWAGHRYGVPLDTNAMLLIFNADRYAEAKVDPPDATDTFADLESQMARLTTPDGSRRAVGLPSSTWAAYGWIRANGGEVVEVGPDGKPRFTLDRPENVEAISFLARLVRSGSAFPPIGRQGDRIDAFALFRAQTTALHASGSWDVSGLERDKVGWKYGVAVMPKGSDGRSEGTVMGGSSMFIPTGSRNRALAFQFMTHLISDGIALRLAQEEGRLPVRLRLYDAPYFATPTLQTFLAQLRTAFPFKLEAFPAAHDAFRNALVDALQGVKIPEVALREAQRRAESS